MEPIFHVDAGLEIPIYRQLVDMIRAAVRKGTLVSGQQLPTVQELSQELGVARGTIKRAYDELEHQGMIEKVQGRGTFIAYQPLHSGSRKEQAMAAIDALLDHLEDMGLSAGEINIFLNLKLRERAEQEDYIKVAVIECNPENLSQMTEQLNHIPQVELHSYLLESIQQYPYKLGEDFDLIVITSTHLDYMESILPAQKRIAQVALRLSTSCLSRIIKLRHGKRVGVVGYSLRFCQLLYHTCETYAEDAALAEPFVFAPEASVEEYLKDKDVVLVPKSYEKYFSAEVSESLRHFQGDLIECYYEMDEGSVLYLETKIKRLLEEKKM